MDLYSLLPAVVRYYDRLATSKAGLDNSETMLQKVLYSIEQEADTTDTLIQGLQQFFNAKNCNAAYLPFIARFLGCLFAGSWPESRKRLFVESLMNLHHTSGQVITWTALLNLFGYTGNHVYELWKEDIYEDFDYSIYGGGLYYGYPLHSARVDIKTGSTDILLSDEELNILEKYRPIHVLIKGKGSRIVLSDSVTQDIADSVVFGSNTLRIDDDLEYVSDSCLSACEGACELLCEAGQCEGSFEVTITCVANCELFCETGCEASCETQAEWSGLVSATDVSGGMPLVLFIQYGRFWNETATSWYNGFIVVVDEGTGMPVTLKITAGRVCDDSGMTPFTGIVSVMFYDTGFPLTLNIVAGRIEW